MLEPHTQKDIEKISYEILKGSKSLDIFPTPIDNVVSYANLVINQGIDLSKIHPDYLSKATDVLKRVLGKLQGVLDRREKVIMLDLTQGKSKQNFVKLHEVGHEVLPWQQKCFDVLEDDDESLDNDVREEFEAEANFFASVTLFQGDRFISEMDKLGLGMESSIQLSKLFGSSIHAALRRYVEYSKNRCALFVLENRTGFGATLRDKFQSPNFTKTFGELSIPVALDYFSWPFIRDYCGSRRFKTDGIIKLLTQNGEVDFQYHFFNNTYNAFVFLFPIGEKKRTRTKIIVTV
jgi:hypothetical protein